MQMAVTSSPLLEGPQLRLQLLFLFVLEMKFRFYLQLMVVKVLIPDLELALSAHKFLLISFQKFAIKTLVFKEFLIINNIISTISTTLIL